MSIKFYKTREEYGEFSNFAKYPITYKGKLWKTSEHAFQAQKFADTEYEEAVRECKTAMDAANMGRDKNLPLRSDWEEVKNDIMYDIVFEKFTQHKNLKQLLIDTGTEELVEHTSNDYYWADGGDGTGKNMLGRILMQVRDKIKD